MKKIIFLFCVAIGVLSMDCMAQEPKLLYYYEVETVDSIVKLSDSLLQVVELQKHVIDSLGSLNYFSDTTITIEKVDTFYFKVDEYGKISVDLY